MQVVDKEEGNWQNARRIRQGKEKRQVVDNTNIGPSKKRQVEIEMDGEGDGKAEEGTRD